MSRAPASARTESRALAAALIAGAVAGFAALLVLPHRWVPLWSTQLLSVGTVAAVACMATGAVTFAVSFVQAQAASARWRRLGRTRRVVDAASVTLASAGVAGLIVATAFVVMSIAFELLSLDRIAGTALTAIAAGIASYGLFLSAAAVDTRRLATLLAALLSAGVLAASLTSDNRGWWWHNFSSLGNGRHLSAVVFNGTLVLSGVLLATLSDHLTVDLHQRSRGRRRSPHRARIVRILLIAVGACIAVIGCVPERVSIAVHNTFALAALAGFLLLFLVTPAVVVELPQAFRFASQCFGVALVIVVAMWVPGGYFNLTATELFAMLMLFAWLVLLARAAAATRDE